MHKDRLLNIEVGTLVVIVIDFVFVIVNGIVIVKLCTMDLIVIVQTSLAIIVIDFCYQTLNKFYF